MTKIPTIGCPFWVVLSAAHADAYWPSRFLATFEGQCDRPNEQRSAVRPMLSATESSFRNLRSIAPGITGAIVCLITGGIIREEAARRSGVGIHRPIQHDPDEETWPDATSGDFTMQAVAGTL